MTTAEPNPFGRIVTFANGDTVLVIEGDIPSEAWRYALDHGCTHVVSLPDGQGWLDAHEVALP